MTFDFNGAKIPNFLSNSGINRGFDDVVIDTCLVPLLFGDCYRRELVEQLDEFMPEGPYGWQDDGFDVTVHKGDIVIDAGAWIGDFAAYAASKGATVYAFEPTAETFAMLEETARLNGPITPVQKGLSDKTGSIELHTNALTGGNSLLSIHGLANTETISITTLDDFVRDNNIPRVDFIKADIEGAERDMLKGARHVLKTFAPRLALCTYHLPDDPEVMARLIMEANPDYQIVQRGKKLYASVPLLVLAENS
jgi:FkbM family methyltransferase